MNNDITSFSLILPLSLSLSLSLSSLLIFLLFDYHCVAAFILVETIEESCDEINRETFRCVESRECISRKHVCDQRYNCKDGSDERNCTGKVQFILINYLKHSQKSTYLYFYFIRTRKASSNTILDIIFCVKHSECFELAQICKTSLFSLNKNFAAKI